MKLRTGAAVNWRMVEQAHRKHPAWNSVQIAELLDCTPEYVRATAKRRGWRIGRPRIAA